MKKEKIILPKKYEDDLGNYPQHKGKYKISYSQITSFKDYMLSYLRDYIIKTPKEDGIFALYGGFCGKYFEDGSKNELLSDFDMNVINKIDKYENSKYESEIVIDLEPFGLKDCVLQGFSDHEYKIKDVLYIDDLKTGNADNKDSKYGDTDKYYQTRLYAYQRENEGHIIGRCQVIHLGRKGNNFILNDKNQLRLTGRIDYIETPYVRSEVEKYLKEEVVSIAKDVSTHYKVYKSFCDEV